MRTTTSPRTPLAEELAAVTGPTCGHSCGWHSQGRVIEVDGQHVPHELVCERAVKHAGATQIIDMHVGHDEHGQIIGFACVCEPAP